MYLDMTAEQRAFRDELRAYFADLITPERLEKMRGSEGGNPTFNKILRQMGSDRLLGIGWPKEFGGQDRGLHLREEDADPPRYPNDLRTVRQSDLNVEGRVALVVREAKHFREEAELVLATLHQQFARCEIEDVVVVGRLEDPGVFLDQELIAGQNRMHGNSLLKFAKATFRVRVRNCDRPRIRLPGV